MNNRTHIATMLDAIAPEKIRYDKNVKEVLADVQILARIVKYTVVEFKELSIDEIIACIDEEQIEIGETPVHPGLTNLGKVTTLATEDTIPNEGTVYFDIRFPIFCDENIIKILINVEAQKSTEAGKLGYHLENRIVYYLSRMISSQKDVEFFRSNYDDIKKAYSIWICMDASEKQDAIHELRFTSETVFGHERVFPYLDKMRGVVIHIRKMGNVEESKNKLIAMLEDLLSKEAHVTKKQKLVEKHGIKMNVEIERRMGEMCNLSDLVEEEGIEKGKIECVRNLIGLLPDEILAEKTGLPLEKIKEIHAEVDAEA